MTNTLESFTDVLGDEIGNSQPLSLPSSAESRGFPVSVNNNPIKTTNINVGVTGRPSKCTGQHGQFRSVEEIDPKYRDVFSYPYFNLVQSRVIEDALYSDKSIVVCAPTGSGKTVVFEMAIVQLLMELEDKQCTEDFKIIYMAPVKALCTERLTEWYSKFTKLGLMCIEVTGDTDVDFTQLKPYKIIITTPEKWDMLTRRWRDHRGLVEVIKLFLIDEVHILNDETRGPVLEAVVSRMKTIESSAQSVHRIEQLQKEIQGETLSNKSPPRIRFVAVSATVSNPEDVASWLGTSDKPAVFYKFGDECRPVKLKRIVEGYPCAEGTSIFKFDIILNYKLWPIIQKYHCGKPTLIFCNTRKSVILTAETLSRELTVSFNAEQKAKLTALASTIKNKTLQALVMSGVGCHHAGLLYEERQNIEFAFRNRDLPILITTTTLAMGVNLPAHLVIVKNTQQYVNGAYQEYSISTVLQMVGRAGRPQFDTEATAVIMTRLVDKPRYQALVGGCEPLQSFLHKRLPENLNSEAALGTVGDVAQCVQWLRSTFLYVRAARDPKKYLGLPQNSPQHQISKKIEELCVKAMNSLASSGLITMDEASCIESTEAGRLMSIFYLDLETMKLIMKVEGLETLERLLALICESHELADMHLRVDERRCLNLLNRNQAAATIRFPMKGKISTRQMKLNCIIQAVLGCLPIPDPSLNQEAMKIMRTADRVCKCLVTYVTRPDLVSQQPMFYSAVLNSILLAKCISAHLWENSPYVSKQLKGIGPTFSTLLATAGKVNFILLEESHPRDLERIMNKGAPAGNVLRKQISLLPKYQLTMIPVDEKTVTLQLLLINQAYLAENMENLTAGERHKSYIIVGDSNNHLLLLATFKDKDLISVFDGTISHEIRRKHNFEHKIFAHCVSSSFVGIDAQAEYLFNDLEPFLGGPNTQKNSIQKNPVSNKKVNERQTCITDTFKERKRKNTDALEKSKEKKKRDSAMIESFKYLKQSFETASKNVNQRVNHQMNTNKESTNNITLGHSEPNNSNCKDSWNTRQNNTPNPTTILNVCPEEMDSDEFIDERKIDSILNEIENEMNKGKPNSNDSKAHFRDNVNTAFNKSTHSLNSLTNSFPTTKSTNYSTSAIRKRKPVTTKSNYNFIELLEKKLSLSDNEDVIEVPQKDNGFSETIKNHIQKYLTKTKTTIPDNNLEILTILDEPQNELPDDTEMNRTLLLEELTNPVREPCPKYEIKEILGQSDTIQNRKVQKANNIECYIDVNDCETIENAKPKRERELPNYNTNMKQLTDFSDKNIIVLDDENYKTDKTNDEHYEVKDNYMQVIESKNDTEVNNCNEMNQNDVQFIKNDEIEPKSMYKTDVNIISPTTEKVQCPGINNTKNSIIDKSLDVNGSVLSKHNIDTERVEDNFDDSLKHISRQIVPLNINQFVANNKTLLTDGINREYLATNISLNQTDCAPSESSFISPPCSNLPNETQSTSNYFSKNIETDQRKAKFVQRFTYVASKIDVCTKQTPEYSMQVIKKMKMDVDITAIVSRKNDSFQNSRADCEQTSNDNIQMIELLKQNNTNREDDEIISTRNNERNHKSNIIFPPMHISTFDSLAILPNEGSLNTNSNVKSTNIKETVPDHNLMGTKNVSNDKVNDALSNNSEHLEANYNCDNLSANIRQTEYENACVGGNKIQNILEKYSKKLSTNLSKPLTPSCSNTTRPGYNSAPKIKTRKPFKITDLHKLHATIPDTIVENKTEVQKELLQSPKLNLFVDVTKIPEKFNRNEFTDNASMQFQDISHCGSLIEMDLEPINEYLSPKIDLEPKAYKIDQSMFNPKKLLQCVADDGYEIVPPPPEFCDDISYSPEEDLSTCGRNELLTSQLNDFTNNDEACNENIFDDNIGTDLTPSKEIETWVLSQEDDDHNSNMSLNASPAKSYTVMRKNCSNNSNFSYKNIMSRHAKLGQFRFSQKNKFKAKK